ncbi:pyridoxamine 5'-phosphate oxidase family protein [Rhodococcus spongiicola]|uniref:Pyridoxamine 5'-phosphate oxidase family protein n=1 Tax=Rhodococcus spongiicola TaxID=2487352 RepID=A0A438B4U2_9NOCA|nr:pyridoxamine 5'-phosphate oxidase family protein [Rhodococcus spongiicola]RVW06013.1 pyridoxamine 5'-phosphate oxidase family protein [Rhodococcus spongiicola]
MSNWTTFANEAPDLARAVAARLEAHKHHVLASLRRDGSPRVSGTEVEIYGGSLLLGSMVGARKVQDLQRDPRFSLHSNPGHHSMDGGDAKITGRAQEILGERKKRIVDHWIVDRHPSDPAEAEVAAESDALAEAEVFELDLEEVVLTKVAGDHLHIDLWRPGKGVTRFTR